MYHFKQFIFNQIQLFISFYEPHESELNASQSADLNDLKKCAEILRSKKSNNCFPVAYQKKPRRVFNNPFDVEIVFLLISALAS